MPPRQKGSAKLGLSSATDAQREAVWHAEFEKLGELLVYDNVKQGAIFVGFPHSADYDAVVKCGPFWLLGERF